MGEQQAKPDSVAVVSGGGVVAVGGKDFHVRKLPITRESAMYDHLASEAKKSFGAGGFLEKGAKALDWLRQSGRSAEWQLAVSRLAEMEGKGDAPSPTAVDDFRRTPDGVALELWHRTRADHPDATREMFRAVLNEANALDVHLAVLDAVTDQKKTPTP